MKKKILLLFSLISFSRSQAQIVITEVYYDTPYLENLYLYTNSGALNPNQYYYNLGEYIELYNYSTEDIPLKGWGIADTATRYQFPDNAIIHKGEFIVVAYRPKGNNVPFSTYFPTTQGKEKQIYYQDKMVLNNKGEDVKLMAGFIRGIDCKKKVIQRMSYKNGVDIFDDTNLYNSYNDPNNLNYYSNSLHLQDVNAPIVFSIAIASPLVSDYIPPTQDIKDIAVAQEALTDVIFNNTWASYASNLLNNLCDDNIPIIEQTPVDTYQISGKCFTYDNLGNTTAIIDCNPAPIINPVSTNYSPDEIDDFEKSIILYPNPTSYNCYVSWSGSILGKITQIQLTTMNSVNLSTINISNLQSTSFVNIIYQPVGIYLVKFILNTGQSINKYVVKL